MQRAALNSLIVACWTTVISVGLGTAAALAIARSNAAWMRGLDLLFMSPLLLPALAFGFARCRSDAAGGLEQPDRRLLDDGDLGRARHGGGAGDRAQQRRVDARAGPLVHVAPAAAGPGIRFCSMPIRCSGRP